MKLFRVLLLMSFFYAGASFETGRSENIQVLVVVILCQALLLSIVVNVYFICMTRYRERCQNFYNDYIAVYCSCDKPNEPEQADEQAPADTRYSALSVCNENGDGERQTEASSADCVYSAVKHA